jgi:NDP-sugar pyrophosphorylase family protein
MANKTRVSLTIDEDVVGRLDQLVDGLYIRSRSEAVEQILSKFLEKEKTAIILCGGKEFVFKETGTPRPLVSVAGKTIIERSVERLREYNFSNIFIVGDQSVLKQIFELLKNGEGYGVRIAYFKESKPQGTAKVLEQLKKYIHSTFLVLPGDTIFDFDLDDMTLFHKENNAMTTVAVCAALRYGKERPKLGEVMMKGNRIIKYFMPKTEEETPKTHIKSTLMLLAEPEVLNYIPSKSVFWDLEEHLFPILINEKRLFAYPLQGNWYNIHSNKDLEEAKNFLENK